jgi:hypothetical protein
MGEKQSASRLSRVSTAYFGWIDSNLDWPRNVSTFLRILVSTCLLVIAFRPLGGSWGVPSVRLFVQFCTVTSDFYNDLSLQ